MTSDATVVFALYPRLTQLDFTAPLEVLGRRIDARVAALRKIDFAGFGANALAGHPGLAHRRGCARCTGDRHGRAATSSTQS